MDCIRAQERSNAVNWPMRRTPPISKMTSRLIPLAKSQIGADAVKSRWLFSDHPRQICHFTSAST